MTTKKPKGEEKSALDIHTGRLKAICEKYETNEFVTFIAGLILHIGERHESPYLKNLHSPMRQLFYLAQLNLEKTSDEKKIGISNNEWDEIAQLLSDIETDYCRLLGFPKSGEELKEDVEKISVMMPTYFNYFFNGPLSYTEQEIEKIEQVLKPHEPAIIKKFGFSLAEFIRFYDLMNDRININLNKTFELPKRWTEFTKACIAKGLDDPKDWINESPEEMKAMLDWMKNPGSILIVNPDNIENATLPKGKIKLLLDYFSCEKVPKAEPSFYTEPNPLLQRPVVKLGENNYLIFFIKQLLHAGYQLLLNDWISVQPVKAYAARDNFAEQKVLDIFRQFFGKEAFYYENYSIDNNLSEQDILILSKRLAIIVEVKAAGVRAPLRDPVRGFDKIKSDFEKTIQLAYDQTYRVKHRFLRKEKMTVVNRRGKLLYELQASKYEHVFSVVVTLDRFGQIQCDLSYLLDIADDDAYPWAVNMDELEAFLLVLGKQTNKIQHLIRFLTHREHFHGHLICGDELELCGLYLKSDKEFIGAGIQEEIIVTYPDLTTPIERAYANGMGFKNERFLQEKKDPGTAFLFDKKY